MDTLFIGGFRGEDSEALTQAAVRGGTGCRFAKDAARGLSALREEPARLAIIDSRVDDLESLVANIRRDGMTFGVPVALQVAIATDLTFTEAHAIGADDALPRGDFGAITRRVANLSGFDPSQRPEATAGTAILAHPDPTRRCLLGRVLRQAGYFVRFAQDGLELGTAAASEAQLLVASTELESFRPRDVVQWNHLPTILLTDARSRLELRNELDSANCVVGIDSAPPDHLLFLANELLRPRTAEIRASVRTLHEAICAFRPAGELQAVHGLTYNISREGFYVRSLDPPAKECAVWLELRPPGSTEAVHLRGRCVWRSPFPGGPTPAGFGVRLDDEACPAADLKGYRSGYEALLRS